MGDRPTRSLLIVEDELLLALMLEDLLLDTGFRVVRAEGLKEALELVERERFDVAILDVNLGGSEVFPLAARLRELQVPFLFASACDPAHIDEQFAQHPLISKPYTIGQVQQSIDDLLGRVRGATQ